MKRIWNVINKMKIKRTMKNKLYLIVLVLINMLLGGLLWTTLGKNILQETQWLLCFMGYPAIFIGFVGGLLFLYNHEFA